MFHRIYDAHLHIIDPAYPLQANQGYSPDAFTCENYLARMSDYDLIGGAVVSGSFQAFDQSYLLSALRTLGPSFVGVTQLPASVSDAQLLELNQAGVRALRFNLYRGGSESPEHLERFAQRVYELVNWHVELYVDARDLADLMPVLKNLAKYSIDHLGLSRDGFAHLLQAVGQGAYVKATGFSRGDLDIAAALQQIYAINPQALMFGTDLPSTRAPKPYSHEDYLRVLDNLGDSAAKAVMCDNAQALYKPESML